MIERNAFNLSHVELPEPEIAQWQKRKQKTQNNRRAVATLAALGAIACFVLAVHFHHIHNDTLTGLLGVGGTLCLSYSVTQLLRNNRTKEEDLAFDHLFYNPEALTGVNVGSDYSRKVDLVWKHIDGLSSISVECLSEIEKKMKRFTVVADRVNKDMQILKDLYTTYIKQKDGFEKANVEFVPKRNLTLMMERKKMTNTYCKFKDTYKNYHEITRLYDCIIFDYQKFYKNTLGFELLLKKQRYLL